MRKTDFPPMWKLILSSSVSTLVLLTLSSYYPAYAAGNAPLAMVEPEVPPPQGVLAVYSERYVIEDSGVPVIYRRPVEVYNNAGQPVASEPAPIGDGPIRFDLSPGHYLVASEDHWKLDKVRVDIKDGEETVVPESLLERTALHASPNE